MERRNRIITDNMVIILEKAAGTRSMAEYANQAGVSPTYISRIKNGERIPTIALIKKLTSPEAAPQNGVTYEEMMDAAGYRAYDSDKDEMFKLNPRHSGVWAYNIHPVRKKLQSDKVMEQIIKNVTWEFFIMTGKNAEIIETYRELPEDNIYFAHPDVILETCSGKRIWMYYLPFVGNAMSYFFRILACSMMCEDSERTLLFITDDKKMTEHISKIQGKTSARRDIHVWEFDPQGSEITRKIKIEGKELVE